MERGHIFCASQTLSSKKRLLFIWTVRYSEIVFFVFPSPSVQVGHFQGCFRFFVWSCGSFCLGSFLACLVLCVYLLCFCGGLGFFPLFLPIATFQ